MLLWRRELDENLINALIHLQHQVKRCRDSCLVRCDHLEVLLRLAKNEMKLDFWGCSFNSLTHISLSDDADVEMVSSLSEGYFFVFWELLTLE